MQWVARDRKDDGKDERVDDAGEGDGIEDKAVVVVWVNAVIEGDEREFGECGWPEVGDS